MPHCRALRMAVHRESGCHHAERGIPVHQRPCQAFPSQGWLLLRAQPAGLETPQVSAQELGAVGVNAPCVSHGQHLSAGRGILGESPARPNASAANCFKAS